MIIWGSGGDLINLGHVETRQCGTCEKDRAFSAVLQYKYFHLYWIFGAVTEKKYLLVCDVCQRGWELEEAKIETLMNKPPIPFMRRWGLLAFIGGIILLVFAVGAFG